jgi:Raf kinase inhibitor-like YbhB/YbcL family protein
MASRRPGRRPGRASRTGRATALAVAVALALVTLAACDTGDGRELRPPPPGATAPPLPTSSTSAPSATVGQPGAAAFTLSSSAFVPRAAIPARHACDGADVSPPLSWSGVPAGTVELAITVVDVSAGGWVHWVVAGIDPAVLGLGEGGVPEGAVQARNDFGSVGWQGPCPPAGEVHDYEFTLHALRAPSGVSPGAPGAQAAAAIEAAAGSRTSITATYGRPA